MFLTEIFIVGFIVLGIYKIIELFVKRKERLMFIEKFSINCENKDISDSFQIPKFSLDNQNCSRSNALKISLLLIGLGIGCFLSFVTVCLLEHQKVVIRDAREGFMCFSYISIFGGLGLLISYLIESKQSKKK
jgi:dipeptide/tripeptide permease